MTDDPDPERLAPGAHARASAPVALAAVGVSLHLCFWFSPQYPG